MKHETSEFEGTGGMRLFAQNWLPDTTPKAVLAIVHGVGEHSGRYTNLVNYLVPQGFALYSFDLRGHGRSQGKRGHINAWDEYRRDVQAFLDGVHANQPALPVFLLGHSLGALIVLDFIMRPPEGIERAGLQGAIISGAPIEPVGIASPFLVFVARILSRAWPTFSLNLGLDTSGLSRDPVVVQSYEADPLVHGKVTPRWGTESMAVVEWVKAHPEKISIPVLFIHGGADPLNTSEGTRRFCEQTPSEDKNVYIYPGSLHEPHNDLDHKQLVRDLETWMLKHLQTDSVNGE